MVSQFCASSSISLPHGRRPLLGQMKSCPVHVRPSLQPRNGSPTPASLCAARSILVLCLRLCRFYSTELKSACSVRPPLCLVSISLHPDEVPQDESRGSPALPSCFSSQSWLAAQYLQAYIQLPQIVGPAL